MRHEYADPYGAVRLLRDDEVLSSAAAESGATRRSRPAVATIRSDDRARAARAACASACGSVVRDSRLYSAALGAFAATARALLHISHLIHGR